MYTLKVLLLLILTLAINCFQKAQASSYELMDIEDNYFNKIVCPTIQKLPSDIIIEIAGYLNTNDFQNFALTYKNLNGVIMNHLPFFMPKTLEEVNQIIEKTPLKEMQNLTYNWNKTPKAIAIPLLRASLKTIGNFFPEEEKSLKEQSKNFKSRVKIMNMLYSFEDPQSIVMFKADYNKIQQGLNSQIDYEAIDHTIINKKLYIFYLKCFSLLDKESRNFLSSIYREGKFAIPVNLLKARKYAEDLNLLLDVSIIDWKN